MRKTADVKSEEGMFTRAIELKLSLRRYTIKLTIEVYFTFPASPHPRNRTADRVYDTAWKKVDVKKLSWELRYDVQAFFMEHDYLTASTIAKRAGINPGLMRQYSSGIKHPSALQAKKIEAAIHTVAKELKAVSLYAA